jgi:hypothetical protein
MAIVLSIGLGAMNQRRYGGHYLLEQASWYHDLGHLEGNRPAMPDKIRDYARSLAMRSEACASS